MNFESYARNFSRTLITRPDIFACDRLHAAVGMAGEIVEYNNATGSGNRLEEAGDFTWYWMLAWTAEVGVYPGSPVAMPKLHIDCPPLDMGLGNYLDGVKRLCFYRKNDRDLKMMLEQIWCMWVEEINDLGVAHVMETNIAKLAARYPTLVWRDEDASDESRAATTMKLFSDE